MSEKAIHGSFSSEEELLPTHFPILWKRRTEEGRGGKGRGGREVKYIVMGWESKGPSSPPHLHSSPSTISLSSSSPPWPICFRTGAHKGGGREGEGDGLWNAYALITKVNKRGKRISHLLNPVYKVRWFVALLFLYIEINTAHKGLYCLSQYTFSFVPRLHPAIQCWTLKSRRAWYAKSREWRLDRRVIIVRGCFLL